MVLLPLAVLVRGVGHRGRFELDVRQLDSNPALPSCSCVTLDKLLNLSGK